MFKTISLTILATFLGQVLSFGVEILIARSFGTTWTADAYFMALIIPLIITDVFALVTSSTFIPIYISHERSGKGQAFFSHFLNAMALISVALAALTFLLAPRLIHLVAAGFEDRATALTVTLTRVLLVLVVTLPLTQVLVCRLNAHGRFALPALGKSFSQAGMAAFLVAFGGCLGVLSLPLGQIAGNLLFLAILCGLLLRAGLRYSPQFDPRHPGLREAAVMALPLIAASLFNYVNIFVERSVASGFAEGSIAALNYAFKIINIPVNLLILAAMTVMLPTFSRFADEGDLTSLSASAVRALQAASFLLTPAIAALVVLRIPVVRVLFERGEFTSASTKLTALSVLCYVFGMLGLGAVTIMSRVFYALKDMKTLAAIGIPIIALNITLMLTLSRILGFVGIPLAFSTTYTVHMTVMLLVLQRRLAARVVAPLLKTFLRHLAGACVMAAVLWAMLAAVGGPDQAPFPRLAGGLCLAAASGLAVYLIVSRLLRVREASLVAEIASRMLGGRK